FLKADSEMSITNSSRQLSPRPSLQAQHYPQKGVPGGPSDGASFGKQTGQASVLIEYFERSSVTHSQQKPSIRVQLHTSPPKDKNKMAEPILSGAAAAGSVASFGTKRSELSPMDTSPASQRVSHEFDQETMPSSTPTSRPQLTVDSSGSPVTRTAYQTSGQESVSSPDPPYDNSIKHHVDRSENNISRSTNRSIKYDPDLLDNIISDVIRRLVLPELDSIKRSTSGGAAIAPQTVTLPANSPSVLVDEGLPSLAPQTDTTDASSKGVDLAPGHGSESASDTSDMHIVADPDMERAPDMSSNECSISRFPQPFDEQQETCASVLDIDNRALTPSESHFGEPVRLECDITAQDTAMDAPVPTTAESHHYHRCHLTPCTGTHLTDDAASDGDAHYFSSDEYPRPMSVTQSDIDRVSESEFTHIPTNTSLSEEIATAVDRRHSSNRSEFSFESGPERPLNISSDRTLRSHVIQHELPSPTNLCHPLDISRRNTNNTFSVTRNTTSSSYGGATVSHIDSPHGIHYSPEDPHSYAPWLKHMDDLDRAGGGNIDDNNITTSSPFSKRNRNKSFDDCLESPIRLHNSASAVPKVASDSKCLTNTDSDCNLGGGLRSSAKMPSERTLLSRERQISHNNIGTPTKSRMMREKKEKSNSSLSNDYVNQYLAALVDKLVANDIRRNQRDTEILTGVARLAAELRMGLEDMRQTMAGENQLSRDEISRIISSEVSKLHGPRPYQPPQKINSPVGQKQGLRKNILLRAFGGIKNNSDLERVENLYVTCPD
ncbi:hypothetical protein V1525DRAFT_344068, partial [Lipomyces kononenkoae]